MRKLALQLFVLTLFFHIDEAVASGLNNKPSFLTPAAHTKTVAVRALSQKRKGAFASRKKGFESARSKGHNDNRSDDGAPGEAVDPADERREHRQQLRERTRDRLGMLKKKQNAKNDMMSARHERLLSSGGEKRRKTASNSTNGSAGDRHQFSMTNARGLRAESDQSGNVRLRYQLGNVNPRQANEGLGERHAWAAIVRVPNKGKGVAVRLQWSISRGKLDPQNYTFKNTGEKRSAERFRWRPDT